MAFVGEVSGIVDLNLDVAVVRMAKKHFTQERLQVMPICVYGIQLLKGSIPPPIF